MEDVSNQWNLNAQNRKTGDGKLTREVQFVLDVNDDNREHMFRTYCDGDWDEFESKPDDYGTGHHRIQGLAFMDHLVIPLGDCPCKGSKCRAAWGWVYDARDLNMRGHRGSLTAAPCESMPTQFNPATGEQTTPPPMGVAPARWDMFQRQQWGETAGLEDFLLANLITAENKTSKHWQLDADPSEEASQ